MGKKVTKKTILVTGGTGYIGSHTVLHLIEAGYAVVILDNLSNSSKNVLQRIVSLTSNQPVFIEGDIRDKNILRNIFKDYSINAVMHFAGLKAVGESEKNPIKYYDNNVMGSIILIDEMSRAGIKNIVFSSSATVYGKGYNKKYDENTNLAPANVYGRTKLTIENMLRDIKKSQPCWQVALLRYFNPVGAHKSGFLGEDPLGIPNNLMPYIAKVSVKKIEKLYVFGNDYPTPDGTGKRDYIHVTDLAAGHLAAIEKLINFNNTSVITVNLGTGKAYSVLEMIHAFERASKKKIPYEIVERRDGDLAEYYADPQLAKEVLNWEAKLDIHRMCEDVWRWQNKNPNGYS